MQDRQTVTRGMRDYTSGRLWGMDCVCVLSRIGKVAAAATVSTLIERFGVTHVLFTGVAGSVDKRVKVGDIVVADALVQHDMDARPLFPRFEIPLLGQERFASDLHLTDSVALAAGEFLAAGLGGIGESDRAAFGLDRPSVHRGLIASGDEFIHRGERHAALRQAFPDLLAVEMEGAAVAQVCFEFGLPFAVIRTISDGADEGAPLDFMQFIERVAARYAYGIVERYCASGRG
ncbi:5'-methylthioadenosine/S-adenosylhomocysteine nucleosidase [Noviherbaspirillum aridicola]|uniref:adenosylhomocysteine nucleosidase n=2 Tax=Noviherbaspirillum aridicola TaxID=2849687 RepID=A0ABQ4Q7H6_9BURK|nr:5'-methylthioadenosine/S-adenosylhomocysteine nucleosidase [Noviherbaspirillum aridicola]